MHVFRPSGSASYAVIDALSRRRAAVSNEAIALPTGCHNARLCNRYLLRNARLRDNASRSSEDTRALRTLERHVPCFLLLAASRRRMVVDTLSFFDTVSLRVIFIVPRTKRLPPLPPIDHFSMPFPPVTPQRFGKNLHTPQNPPVPPPRTYAATEW